jgi:signal transduction histidine kinase
MGHFTRRPRRRGSSRRTSRRASTLAQLDFDRVLQVLANMVSNAIKFTPGGGSIALRA